MVLTAASVANAQLVLFIYRESLLSLSTYRIHRLNIKFVHWIDITRTRARSTRVTEPVDIIVIRSFFLRHPSCSLRTQYTRSLSPLRGLDGYTGRRVDNCLWLNTFAFDK